MVSSQVYQYPKVVFCLPAKQFPGTFWDSWSSLLTYCLNRKIPYTISCQHYNDPCDTLNACISGNQSTATPFNGELDYDYIMWFSPDFSFQPEQFETLLGSGLDIVAGYAVDMNENTSCGAIQYQQNGDEISISPLTELSLAQKGAHSPLAPYVEVDWTDSCFLLVKRGVYESISFPWYYDDGTTTAHIRWSLKVKKAGYKIHIDPRVKIAAH